MKENPSHPSVNRHYNKDDVTLVLPERRSKL